MDERYSDERYPIGRFKPPDRAGAEARRGWLEALAVAPAQLRAAVAGLSSDQLDTPYREGGWTLRQVVHHLADSHGVAYTRFRLTLIQPSPTFYPYDETKLAALPDAAHAPIEASLEMFGGLHGRWCSLLEGMAEEDFYRSFSHPERGKVTLEGQLTRSSWHGRHHIAQITALRGRKGW